MPRCKNCKKTFKPRFFLDKYCQEEVCQDLMIKKAREKVAKKQKKELAERLKVMKVESHSTDNKNKLGDEINKLARMIDAKFKVVNCIDCGKLMDKEKNQIDACHLISKGSNSTLRWHLHNLHSGHNHCNFHSSKHEVNYRKNLAIRYGNEYLEMIDGLPLVYKTIKLTSFEVVEKLKIVRKLIRDFETLEFENPIAARTLLNKVIGIYDKD